jgi:hypothetical protein
LYDDPAESIEIGSIRPISAPNQTSIYNEIEELSSLPRSYNESVFNEEVEDLNYDRYSQSITSYTGFVLKIDNFLISEKYYVNFEKCIGKF